MEREPVEVFCLAEFLAEEMQARGWNAADVAIRMKTGKGWVRDAAVVDLLLAVQRDNLRIDDATFAGLARAFGVSEEMFRNLDAVWRKWPDRRAPFTCPEHLFSGVWRSSDAIPTPPESQP